MAVVLQAEVSLCLEWCCFENVGTTKQLKCRKSRSNHIIKTFFCIYRWWYEAMHNVLRFWETHICRTNTGEMGLWQTTSTELWCVGIIQPPLIQTLFIGSALLLRWKKSLYFLNCESCDSVTHQFDHRMKQRHRFTVCRIICSQVLKNTNSGCEIQSVSETSAHPGSLDISTHCTGVFWLSYARSSISCQSFSPQKAKVTAVSNFCLSVSAFLISVRPSACLSQYSHSRVTHHTTYGGIWCSC